MLYFLSLQKKIHYKEKCIMAPATENSTFTIGGIKGPHCRDRIKNTISQLDGVQNVNIDMQSSQINVSYQGDVINDDYISDTLQALGYTVQRQ
jgi:copper chaperone